MSSSEKTKQISPSGSVFADKIELVKKTEFGLDFTKLVGCILDVYGIYVSNLLVYKIKAYKPAILRIPKRLLYVNRQCK